MVGVDTHIVILEVEGVLAELYMLKFILVKVRPTPQPGINHMRKTFSTRHLQPPVQSPLYGYTLAWVDTVGGDGSNERVQLIFLLLEFLDQALNSTFGKALVFTSLPVAHQAVHNTQTGIIAAGCVDRHDDAGIQLISQRHRAAREFIDMLVAQV